MILSASFLLVSMAILSHAFPLQARLEHDDDQALFAVSANTVHEISTMPTMTTASTIASASSDIRAQPDHHTAVTSVLFAPFSTPAPSSDRDSNQGSNRAWRPIVAAYYPDWTAAQLSPEMVDFTKIDWVDFAFAVPDPLTFTPKLLEADSESLLHRLVAAAHSMSKKVKLSIGGWTGSGHFSDAVRTENRNSFAHDILDLYHKFDLDGIDIDWEYPGEQGAAGNTYSPADSANFLAFLQLLRSLLPLDACITAATQVWPFVDATGEHMKDISPFSQVLDWVLLMNYDVWGSSPTPGPNAPLSDACRNSSQPEANARAAIASWSAAGFPPRQIMLGLPAYGYVSKSTETNLRTRRRSLLSFDRTPIAAEPVGVQGLPTVVKVKSEDGSTVSGQVQFNALIAQGALKQNAPGVLPAFIGAGGFERQWDLCSSTPFLRSVQGEQIITYDDPESLRIKAAFAKDAGILGVNMWDAHGDTANWDLIGSMRRGLDLD